MTTMNLSLPDELNSFVEAQSAQEGHASAEDYVRSLIREAQKRQARQELEARLREAIETGPATPLTRADWDDLERRVWERHAQSTTPKS